MPNRVGDVFTHPADHVTALVVLVIVVAAVIFMIRAVLRVRAAWRASGISLPTVRGLMSMRSMATQMANSPEVQKLIAEQMSMVEGAGQAQTAAERIANLEQLHAQGQLTDAKLAELKAAIQKEPTTTAPTGVTSAASQTAMLAALRKSGFLSEDMLGKITAAMGAAGVSAAHSSIVTSAMAPDVPGVPDSADVVARKAQQAKLAMIDDLHNRHVIDDAQYAAAREHLGQLPDHPPGDGPVS